ncbi:hypothetical protein SBA5_590042 [Candidatus Sulfotelmatomonas gaucii]|uniref:Uncharacterized protein n=1 Tax=Candidatus Sulfuritelmatomonas gaucii TaxID=2043161 RepID=A0A2N9LVT5_9BACT|nr:hypothetical protein SBA5_590042 [Candidatus Sulfotelmatomonas gaucii]
MSTAPTLLRPKILLLQIGRNSRREQLHRFWNPGFERTVLNGTAIGSAITELQPDLQPNFFTISHSSWGRVGEQPSGTLSTSGLACWQHLTVQ